MKKITLVFKSGAIFSVLYSAKLFAELTDNIGKDHKVDAKNYSVNTKNLDGVFYEVEEAPAVEA